MYGQQKEETKVQGQARKKSKFVERIRQIHLKVQEQLEKSQE
jgi:hypothetical protein